MVDVPLLRKAVEWVEAQSELPTDQREWWQADWYGRHVRCGTTACVAGKVALDAGWQPRWRANEEGTDLAEKDGECHQVTEIAQDLLGIDDSQAYLLFNGSNSAQGIRNAAETIAGQRL